MSKVIPSKFTWNSNLEDFVALETIQTLILQKSRDSLEVFFLDEFLVNIWCKSRKYFWIMLHESWESFLLDKYFVMDWSNFFLEMNSTFLNMPASSITYVRTFVKWQIWNILDLKIFYLFPLGSHISSGVSLVNNVCDSWEILCYCVSLERCDLHKEMAYSCVNLIHK